MTLWQAPWRKQETDEGKPIRLVMLQISFIGWGLISILTLGIGLLWLNGYILCTTAWFYKDFVSFS